jgi:acetyl esterase/lipase
MRVQRHARKLKARAFAPRYRLAPQHPFRKFIFRCCREYVLKIFVLACGLQDILSAYLFLLEEYDPKTILFAGDSAGGGMISSVLITIRDQGLPLPAGAILMSPWVDLTHSFPSICGDGLLDYIPITGFIHRPSLAWPPPKIEENVQNEANTRPSWIPAHVPHHQAVPQVALDGQIVEVRDQIQLYAANFQLGHPLVSSALSPSLGGLCPLLIQVGGAELLSDEQIYYAHKAANPAAYPPSDEVLDRYDPDRKILKKYPPTDVQLQIYDDLCHVPHTLAWTEPAKYMFRSAAQFGAWAYAKAQHTELESGDDASETSGSGNSSSTNLAEKPATSDLAVNEIVANPELSKKQAEGLSTSRTDSHLFTDVPVSTTGSAGDPLPRFQNHMIRQRVTRKGEITPLEGISLIPCLNVPPNEIGIVKEAPVNRWRERQMEWDKKNSKVRAKMDKLRAEIESVGLMPGMENENPPPTALVRRWQGEKKTKGAKNEHKEKKKAAVGLRWWQSWQSKHDKEAVEKS